MSNPEIPFFRFNPIFHEKDMVSFVCNDIEELQRMANFGVTRVLTDDQWQWKALVGRMSNPRNKPNRFNALTPGSSTSLGENHEIEMDTIPVYGYPVYGSPSKSKNE